MEFFDAVGNRLNFAGRQSLLVKWTASPEPLTPDRRNFDSTKLSANAYRQTIISVDEGEPFPVAVKNEGDTECYVVTGDTYERVGIEPFLRHRDFRVDEAEFKVRMVASSGHNTSNVRTWTIRNGGNLINQLKL